MSWVRKILEKLIQVQDKYYPTIEKYIEDIKKEEGNVDGRCSILTVYGPKGGSFKLMIKNGKLAWADDNVKPLHHFKTSEDTFLDLILGEIDFQEAIDKKLVVIENVDTQMIDIVEMRKWAKVFERLERLLKKIIGGDVIGTKKNEQA